MLPTNKQYVLDCKIFYQQCIIRLKIVISGTDILSEDNYNQYHETTLLYKTILPHVQKRVKKPQIKML